MSRLASLRPALFPFIVLLFLTLFSVIYRLLHLPNSEELVKIAGVSFSEYGYWVVFAGAFLEATPVINLYLPGSAVIVLGVAYSRHGSLNVFLVVAVASIGILLAYILDYAMGKYGWHKVMIKCGLGPSLEKTEMRLVKHGLKWMWASYFHPDAGALAATSCGVLNVPLTRFVIQSALAIACWNTLWGTIAYYGADQLFRLMDMRWLILVVTFWLIWSIIKSILKNRRDVAKNQETV